MRIETDVGIGKTLNVAKKTMKRGETQEEREYWHWLGKRLRQFRLQANLNQQQLAEVAGISRAELQFIEAGRRRAKIPTLKRCCKGLNIPLIGLLAQVEHDQEKAKLSSGG